MRGIFGGVLKITILNASVWLVCPSVLIPRMSTNITINKAGSSNPKTTAFSQ